MEASQERKLGNQAQEEGEEGMNSIQPTKKTRRLDPRMIVGALAGLYGLSPIDGIPDFLPVIGQADDVVVIVMAIALILVLSMGGEE